MDLIEINYNGNKNNPTKEWYRQYTVKQLWMLHGGMADQKTRKIIVDIVKEKSHAQES